MLDAIFSWNTLWVLLLVLYIPSCVGLIIIVLLQKGKGTGFAGAFGIGPGSDTVFGPRNEQKPTRTSNLRHGGAVPNGRADHGACSR